MKFSISLSLIALLGVVTMQAASAQETRGARFNFAPNVWKSESSRLPKGYGDYAEPQHNVHSGAVPKNDILGVDPLMLSKPAPAAPVVTTAVSPQMMVPTTTPKFNGSFNPAFGKPQLAQLPVPQQAVALPMVPTARPAAAKPVQVASKPIQASRSVSARLRKPNFPTVRPASASPAVASYPTDFGYTPSSILTRPAQAGSSATTRVSGRVILHKQH